MELLNVMVIANIAIGGMSHRKVRNEIMDENKALNILSIMQMAYKTDSDNEAYQALELALGDIALVMTILFIYNEYEGEDYLYVLDDIIKAFVEQRSAK